MKKTNLASLMSLYKRGVIKAKELIIEGEELQNLDFESLEITRITIETCKFTLVNFTNCYFYGINFTDVKFYNVSFTNCRFEDCEFFDTIFENVTINYSIFKKSNFLLCFLHNSNFLSIKLIESYFSECKLRKNRLHACILEYSGIFESLVEFCKFYYCTFSNFYHEEFTLNRCSLLENIYANTDLTFLTEGVNTFKGIQRVDYLSVVRTINEPDLSLILTKCGIPDLSSTYLIDSIQALETNIIRKLMQSVFISYGGGDQFFASILNIALKKDGINTYFFPESSIPGQKLHRIMRAELRKYDRVIFICSESSLSRSGVLNELENVLSKEAELGGEEILIPITIDDYVFEKWTPKNIDYSVAIKERVITKFGASFPDATPNLDSTRHKIALAEIMRRTNSYKKLLLALTNEIISDLR